MSVDSVNGQTGVVNLTASDIPDAVSQAGLALPGGAELVGFLQAGSSAVSRTILSKSRDWVSALDFGLQGGNADDTGKIQNALNTGKAVIFPDVGETFMAAGLRPQSGQQLLFTGGPFSPWLVGGGTDVLIKVGDGTGTVRRISIIGMNAENKNFPVVQALTAPNFILENCSLASTNADCVDLRLSYRAIIKSCALSSSGPDFWAIKALNNVNGLVLLGNTVSGGAGGGAIKIGQSQGIVIEGQVIESSLRGIHIASSADVDDGNCNGVVLHGNYVEQSAEPFVLATQFSARGVDMSGNYLGNSLNSSIVSRTAAVYFGRLSGSRIANNAFYLLDGIEDLYRIDVDTASGDITNLRVENNSVNGTPANVVTYTGAFGSNSSTLRAVGGGTNFLDFLLGGTGQNKQVFISRPLTANLSTGNLAYIPSGSTSIGGRVLSVEIIEASASGSSIACTLSVGRSSSINETVNAIDLSSLAFSNGHARLILATPSATVHSEEDNLFRITAGTGTATFCLKITYTVN